MLKSLVKVQDLSESQTATRQGEAKLRILDFKTTWSEFQRPSQTRARYI